MTILGVEFIDWLIMLALLTAGVGGFRLGFITRAASWVGMLIGVVVSVLLLPPILRNAGEMSATSRLGVVILLMLLGSLLGQMIGLFAGSRLSANVPPGRLRLADQFAGALAGLVGVFLVLWLTLPAAANVPGWSAQQVRRSTIAQAIYDNAPKPPNAMQTLQRLVGSNGFPLVFEGIAQSPDSGPSPESVTLPVSALDAAKASTVKVEGIACHRTQDGSGFVVAKNVVATNAHVVAGEDKTTVIGADGEVHSAVVMLFDAKRDLALLSVPDLDAPALPIGDARVNETAAVFGHPGGQDEVAVTPAAVRREVTAVGRDLYGEITERDILILASSFQQGNSGGPLVNDQGEVIGVVFAIAPDKPETGYALHTTELEAVLRSPHDARVDTGPCVFD